MYVHRHSLTSTKEWLQDSSTIVCIYVHVCIYLSFKIAQWLCDVCMYVCIQPCAYVCMYVVCEHVCIYVCMYICMEANCNRHE